MSPVRSNKLKIYADSPSSRTSYGMRSLAAELKKLEIVKKGKFTLTSGNSSGFYIDMKKVLGHPRVSELICSELCNIVDKKATCIASIGYGGLPLASRVALKLGLPLVVVREKPRKHGLKNLVDGYVPTGKDRVAVVDDVFTTGSSMLKITKALSKTKAKIFAGYVVVNRGDIAKSFEIKINSLLDISRII